MFFDKRSKTFSGAVKSKETSSTWIQKLSDSLNLLLRCLQSSQTLLWPSPLWKHIAQNRQLKKCRDVSGGWMTLQQFESHVKMNNGGRKWRSCVVLEENHEEVSPQFGRWVTLHPVFRETEQQSSELITTQFIKWRPVLQHVCSTCDSPPHLQPVTQHLWWNRPEHWLTQCSSDEGFVRNASCRVTRPLRDLYSCTALKIWTETQIYYL